MIPACFFPFFVCSLLFVGDIIKRKLHVNSKAWILCSRGKNNKHACFWDADGNRKWAVFPFNLSSHNHIYIAKYLFSIRDDSYKNLGDTSVLAREMLSSGYCPRLKNMRAYCSRA